jgi:hypothetical protein
MLCTEICVTVGLAIRMTGASHSLWLTLLYHICQAVIFFRELNVLNVFHLASLRSPFYITLSKNIIMLSLLFPLSHSSVRFVFVSLSCFCLSQSHSFFRLIFCFIILLPFGSCLSQSRPSASYFVSLSCSILVFLSLTRLSRTFSTSLSFFFFCLCHSSSYSKLSSPDNLSLQKHLFLLSW